MSYRTFVDRDGAYWQVWDSQPSRVERRMCADDRRHVKRFPWRGAERRSGVDRRTLSQRRITLSEGYGRGWLTFESLDEKRRLVPIPNGWEEAGSTALRALCEQAKRIAKTDGGTSAA
ncbi:MAG TPA: hypothetical protein VGQ98_02205 [Gemmatimonadaceae bacterium]|nr:hypothetical protein [Gemmatimonadaceae bacterium]